MELRRHKRQDSEMEIAVQRLLGSNVKKQIVNIEPREPESAGYSFEITHSTRNSKKESQLPNISHKNQKKVKPKKQSEESVDRLISLAHSLTKT